MALLSVKNLLLTLTVITWATGAWAQAETQNPTFPFWKVNGNSGTNSSTNFLGNTDNVSLRIRTNNLQRVVIDSTGNVGINTGIATQKLDVNGSCLFRNGEHTGGITKNQLLFGYNGTSDYTHAIKTRHNGSATGANAIDFYIWSQGVDASTTVGTKRVMTIDGFNNGCVGIGISNPAQRLHVGGTDGVVRIGSLATGGANITNAAATTDKLLYADANGDLKAIANGTSGQALTINSSGIPAWASAGASTAWNLTGNAGTTISTNFIGTTDNNALRFKVNNINCGLLTTSSVFIGRQAGDANTASFNTGVGGYSLNQVTTGAQNSALGYGSLTTLTTGTGNTAMGMYALGDATATDNNSAFGRDALRGVTTGSGNVAVGKDAGDAIVTGTDNVSIGYSSDCSDGLTNATAIGARAIATASNSVVLGSISGVNGATATVNVGIGVTAPTQRLDVSMGAILIRNGNGGANTNKEQLQFGYNNTTDYRHAIKTRHNASVDAGNAIDFFVWDQGTDAPTAVATKRVMTIDGNSATGSVGIGISTPAQQLDVNGTGLFRNGNGNVFTNNQLLFGYNGTTNYQHAIKTRHNGSGTNGNAIDFFVWKQGTDATGTVGTKAVLTIDGGSYNDGYVGIGTTTPGSVLHVVSTQWNTAYLQGSDVIGTALYIQNGSANSDFYLSVSGSASSKAGTFVIENTVGEGLVMDKTTNYVALGGQLPSQRLDVMGAGLFRNGNGNDFTNSQLLLAYNGTSNYAHAVKSRHNSGTVAGNAIDFFVWNQAADNAATTGTKRMMTLEAGGYMDLNGDIQLTPGEDRDIFIQGPTWINDPGYSLNLSASSSTSTGTFGTAGGSITLTAGNTQNSMGPATGGNIIITSGGNTNSANTGVNGGYIALRTGGANNSVNERVRIKENGFVGINTTTPACALDVSGSGAITMNYGYLNASGGVGVTNGQTNSYTIRASSRIAASEFNAFSDIRIKKIIDRTNNAEDLATLNQIAVTNYRFIDTLEKGTRLLKKVIAQELEQVYPNAINTMTYAVPDIYSLAEINDCIITVDNNLKEGDTVKLLFAEHTEVIKVMAANSKWLMVDIKDEGKVFVYGRQVSDFRTVDYEALTTLAISSIQQLNKENESLKKDNAALKEAVYTMGADIEILKQLMGAKAAK